MIVGSEGDTNDQSRSVNRNLKIKHDFFSICGAKKFSRTVGRVASGKLIDRLIISAFRRLAL